MGPLVGRAARVHRERVEVADLRDPQPRVLQPGHR
jgi:hypothetical protein